MIKAAFRLIPYYFYWMISPLNFKFFDSKKVTLTVALYIMLVLCDESVIYGYHLQSDVILLNSKNGVESICLCMPTILCALKNRLPVYSCDPTNTLCVTQHLFFVCFPRVEITIETDWMIAFIRLINSLWAI